jgi:hypothetical protein
MTVISKRLRKMKTAKGQSLHKLEREACDESDRLFCALKRLSNIALNVFDAGGEQFEALEEAINTLARAGDPAAISANAEWKRFAEHAGLSM